MNNIILNTEIKIEDNDILEQLLNKIKESSN